MYVKVFRQIFESSIAEDYTLRHLFMDLLVLADIDGIVDMTHESIARVTNVPIEIVRATIEELERADPKSRSDAQEGRRIVRLDDHREWGWKIVNYEVYRNIRDEEARRAYFREKKREQRAKARVQKCHSGHGLSNPVLDCPTLSNVSTHTEAEADTDKTPLPPSEKKPTRKLAADWSTVPLPLFLESVQFRDALGHWIDHRKIKRDPLTQHALELLVKECESWGQEESIRNIEHSIKKGWKGVYAPDKPQPKNNGSCL